ncbi:hypothetical protein E2562_006769, partial [Oryza meyeriana var. granulata]
MASPSPPLSLDGDEGRFVTTLQPLFKMVMIMKKPQAFGVVFKRSKIGLRDLPWWM